MRLLKICFSYFLCVCSIIIIAEKNTIIAEEREPSLRYQIWVELNDQDKMLYGNEEIVWVNKSQDEVQDMWFHLYYNAFKNEKSAVIKESKESIKQFGINVKDGEWGWIDVTRIYLADGRDLTPTMEFVTQDEPIHPDDQTVMRVIFPEPVIPGEEVHISIEFQSKIPRTILRSGYYKDSYFIAQWFPKPGVYEEGKGWNCHAYHLNSEFFADFADFTVHITVPEKFVVGASGKQIKAKADKESGIITYTYHQKNIHDFAWTADHDFIKIERDFIADGEITKEEYQEVARMLQLPLDDVKLPDVKMILLINPEHKGQIERHFNALKAALKYYGLWYGPYPYETVTMVDPPFRTRSGGMEYPTLFTAGTSILNSKDVLSPEGVIIHEFGHGYWYGLCANNEFEEAWLDEGINTYSTGKVIAKAYGPGIMPAYFNRIPMNWFFKFSKYYDYELDRTLGIHVVELDPITTYSWKFFNIASYGLNVYQRASTCLYTLERLVGPETMLRILRTFQTRFRFRHPHTQDFIGIVNEMTGKDYSWFFDELFFKTLNFDYGISSISSKKMKEHVRGVFDINGKKEEVTKEKIAKKQAKDKKMKKKPAYLSKVKVRRFGEARVGGESDLKIKVVFEDGSEETVFWKGQERWKEFVFKKPVKAKYTQIDPESIWLIDSNISNNSLKLKPSRKGIFRFIYKIIFMFQNSIQFLSALS